MAQGIFRGADLLWIMEPIDLIFHLFFFFFFSIECICELVTYFGLIYYVLDIYLALFIVLTLSDHVACYWIFRVHICANVVLVKTFLFGKSMKKYISKFIKNKTLKNYQSTVCYLPYKIKNGQKLAFEVEKF